ncbi:MAG: hypothetical protein GX465_16845, partial [Acidobacteria bacterium]|nr:hypothetical protein [Acidobacteriota bacterium]
GNWSTADSLDTKIKKELASGIQDVIAILKSVKYFKEDPKEVALNEAYKKIAQDIFDTHVKLNYNCPADEKIGSGKGSCSGNTDNKSSDVIPDIPKDIVLGKDFDTIRAAINRKEFNLKTTKKEGMYETTYRIMISPKKIPQNWKSKINSIDSTTTWYDPKYMKEVPFGNGKSTILKPINPEMEKVISLPSGKESGYLFRGMSYEEFENINKSGFIKTLAEYNFDFQGDMTFFADDKGTASNYASGFAPWQYGPTIDKPAVMIKIRDPGNHEPGATEGEIGIKGKIPADLIEEVYFGHPVSMTQGYTEIINDKFNKSVYKGNGSSYKATVAWESRPYKNQKQNANCKQEEKVGSGPGSCSGGLKDSIQPAKVDLHPKLDPGDYNGLLKASKAIRNDKSEPDRVLRRMMAEEVERKFIRETKESVQASKEANDEFIKNSGNDTWNKLSSESQSAI